MPSTTGSILEARLSACFSPGERSFVETEDRSSLVVDLMVDSLIVDAVSEVGCVVFDNDLSAVGSERRFWILLIADIADAARCE